MDQTSLQGGHHMVPVHTPWPLVLLDGIKAHFNFIWFN
jgi:hypothetical protein